MRLGRLSIDDFGLIAHASFAFSGGLTIVSGETGSGKTMLLGALGFALGDRVGAEMIRSGAERARVTLEVEPDAALRALLAEHGIALAADDDAILTREITATGRSQARVNGAVVSASQLREIGRSLVDIVGQHEAQRLLAPGYALELLDGARETSALRERVAVIVHERSAILAEIAAIRDDEGRALAAADYAAFALREIDDARLIAGEDEKLRERRDYLTNIEKIAAALTTAHDALENESGAVDALGAASSALAGVARYDATLAELATTLAALQSDLTESAGRIAREREAADYDPAELEGIGARLELLDRLKKKFGGSLANVLAAREVFAQTQDGFVNRDRRIAQREDALRECESEVIRAAGLLTKARTTAARMLEKRVGEELGELAMPAARLQIAFAPVDPIGPSGAERAELLLAANPGEPFRPLGKSASGGELSRVLLALIVALAERRERTALVFDEIDAGIGGATASAVGTRLGRLASAGQVVCVTHLAQIASWADAHYALRKREDHGTTVVELETLATERTRLEEIARMLSGETGDVALEHAATLVRGVAAKR